MITIWIKCGKGPGLFFSLSLFPSKIPVQTYGDFSKFLVSKQLSLQERQIFFMCKDCKPQSFVSRAEITKFLFALKESVPGAKDLIDEMHKGLSFAEAEKRAAILLQKWRSRKKGI